VGLDEFFEEMVEGPQPAWLMEQGYLSKYRMFVPQQVTPGKLVGNMINLYRQNMDGYKFVGFARNIASSIDYARQFTAAGIPCAHLDGNTKKEERARIIRAYADGELQGLFNVSLFLEGFDLSAVAGTDVTIDGLIDNQKTESYAIQKQKWGRVLRPKPGKVAVINDHVGNDDPHGYPDDEEVWSLRGDLAFKDRKKSQSGKPPPYHCATCYNSLKRPLPVKCPHCSTAVPDGMDNILTHKPGQIVEVDESRKNMSRQARKAEEMACKSLNELVALAVRRGHKNPTTWASEQWAARVKKYAMIG
jgi:superfamily II DNA or RNA helicase